ncbi:nicotinate-nucleotide--dimethylbenzimidazole phosphoribosyltransferase [Dyadobacter jejuensis]|uniref:Nicotinate-nucleotide--dimethylbenzimidazole phosphoribosyltransferase n=1 Tax=Dyadobacter jejuensis TaxID=1082580 RepID=A0A316AC95_9BACT|nr:nicotinate-nucleotide--dimethylbenzimidazole phosphoribosyltransferase [Dyadobacter jejuensis]PWJ55039.1 nicotinate-nucleotide--dimethylbenzimidazole phosphoribosyltransferase [Dyadobacter jejuensis]
MDTLLKGQIQAKIDQKTKPLGSLGMLERLAVQISGIQQTLTPALNNPQILVFAGSHGIANSGVSAYPPAVTAQMVLNFLQGGAAINVLTRQAGMALQVVDAGVDFDFGAAKGLVNMKVRRGTRNFLEEPAMTTQECSLCIERARTLVQQVAGTGCNVIGFGEMGIGNTSAASVMMSKRLQRPLADCVGMGTGLSDVQLAHKLAILEQAMDRHAAVGNSPLEVLQTFGGYEMAMMAGAMVAAGERGMVILVDGFIATVAYLCAVGIAPEIADNAIFCHESEEKGHRILLQYLQAQPVLQLGMRLGEGTGCALAFPILRSAVAIINEMASFDSAGVNQKEI